MPELHDFYQCHEAGKLFEMHINYDCHWWKIDPKDIEEVSEHQVHTAAVPNTSKTQFRMRTPFPGVNGWPIGNFSLSLRKQKSNKIYQMFHTVYSIALEYWPKTVQVNPTQQKLFNKQLSNGEQLARLCARFFTDPYVFSPNRIAQEILSSPFYRKIKCGPKGFLHLCYSHN